MATIHELEVIFRARARVRARARKKFHIEKIMETVYDLVPASASSPYALNLARLDQPFQK